jgi:hypothetical protein
MGHSTATDQRRMLVCVKHTLRTLVPSFCPPSFDAPVVVGLGEGADQKVLVLRGQLFYCDISVKGRVHLYSIPPYRRGPGTYSVHPQRNQRRDQQMGWQGGQNLLGLIGES